VRGSGEAIDVRVVAHQRRRLMVEEMSLLIW
jgi:hypothetical protein